MKMQDNQEYKKTIQSNLIFGGIKIFKSLITVVQTKIVAIFLGPTGVGFLSLITSTINTLHQLTTCGIFVSGVRSIAIEKSSSQKPIAKVLNLLSLVFGILGSIVTSIFAQKISVVVFGTPDYKIWFIIVSISLLFESLTNAQISIFQGTREIYSLAKSSVIGAISSLIVSFPLYYYFGIDAIPYVVVLSYFLIAMVYYVYRCKVINLRGVRLNINVVKKEGKTIVKLGTILALSGIFMTLLVFLQNAIIRKVGEASDVGLFQAAQSCSYYAISVIIAIISTDFYPKITSRISDRDYVCLSLNQQCEILLVLASIITGVIIVFPTAVIRLLYSEEFLSINSAIQIMALSLVWRVVWHVMSYVILAHGDKKVYMIYDTLLGNGLFFLFNILGYYFGGINGIAIAYLIGTIFVSLMLMFVVNYKYNLSLDISLFKQIGTVLCVLIAIVVNNHLNYSYCFYLSVVGLVIVSVFSLKILNKHFNIFDRFKI